jgi:DNA-directed RNA polymerase subunit RPC12/RpoP
MCPHCGTNNPPIIDKDWLFRCPKCSRGKVRPLLEEMPLTAKLKKIVRTTPKKEKPEPITVQCVDCPTVFTTMNHSMGKNRTMRCPVCQVAYNKARERRYYESYQRKDRKIKKLRTTAGADPESGVKAESVQCQ